MARSNILTTLKNEHEEVRKLFRRTVPVGIEFGDDKLTPRREIDFRALLRRRRGAREVVEIDVLRQQIEDVSLGVGVEAEPLDFGE